MAQTVSAVRRNHLCQIAKPGKPTEHAFGRGIENQKPMLKIGNDHGLAHLMQYRLEDENRVRAVFGNKPQRSILRDLVCAAVLHSFIFSQFR